MIAPEDRALYLREILVTLNRLVRPELTSAGAIDAAACAARVLAHLIIAEEQGEALEQAFAGRVAAALPLAAGDFTPALRQAEDLVAAGSGDRGALVAAEREYLERIAAARDELLAVGHPEAQDASAPSITPEQLRDYLRRRLDAPLLSVESMTLVPGGRSKETLLIELAEAGTLPTKLVMRKDLQVSLTATRSSDEFAILQIAAEAGVPAPKPLLAEADPEALGGTFILVSLVAGEKKGEIFPDVAFPTEGRREIGVQLAQNLARIHAIPLERLDLPLPTREASRAGILTRIDAGRARFRETDDGEPSVIFELACLWLRENVDRALVGPIVLRHGDLGLHNMLIDGVTVTAMLDWEYSSIGYAVADMGSVRHTAKALMPWEDFVETYVAAGGDPAAADPIATRFYSILAKISGMANTEWGGRMFRNGRRRSIVTANSATDFRYRLGRMLADEMSEL